MATEMVPIRSIKAYVREFGYEGLVKQHADRKLIREQILDAFQKEVFGQIVFKYRDTALLSRPQETVDDKIREGVRHIISNSRWKWNRLVSEFDKYPETRNLLSKDELLERLQDIVKIQEKERDDPENPPIDDSPVETVVTTGQINIPV